MRATHTITGTASLQRALWLRRGTRIALALPSFSVVQQESLEARINRQLSASGNELCTVALIASLVGCILFDAARWSIFTAHTMEILCANLFVCLIAAAFGKTFGVLRARWQLAQLIRAVAERIEEADNMPFSGISSPRGESFATHNRGVPGLSRAS